MDLEKQNAIYGIWQCPNCDYVNNDISNYEQLKSKEFTCIKCYNKYKLEKHIIQILYKPIRIDLIQTSI